MEPNLVLGVDAGSTHVVAALAERVEGDSQVIGVGLVPSAGVHRGLIVDMGAAAEAVQKAVTAACQMADRTGVTRAVVSISGAHLLSQVGSAEVPVHRPSAGVTPEAVRQVLDAAAASVAVPANRELVHVVPRSYTLDGEAPVRDPIGLCGRILAAEAQVVSGEALPIQNHLRMIRQAGLEVADYQVAVRAAGEAVLSPQEREQGVLLLDMGGGTTGVAVYENGHLYHLAVLPVGGEHITHDLAAVLRVPVETAEQIKREQGWASAEMAPEGSFELVSPSGRTVREVTDKHVAEIIESRVEEILQLAAATVKRSGYTGLFPGGLVLTGGGSRLQGLAAYAADCLSLKSRIGVAQGPLAGEPEMATAAGLALWGLQHERTEESKADSTQEQNRPAKTGRVRDWLKALFH